jgi:hypothetical protein
VFPTLLSVQYVMQFSQVCFIKISEAPNVIFFGAMYLSSLVTNTPPDRSYHTETAVLQVRQIMALKLSFDVNAAVCLQSVFYYICDINTEKIRIFLQSNKSH